MLEEWVCCTVHFAEQLVARLVVQGMPSRMHMYQFQRASQIELLPEGRSDMPPKPSQGADQEQIAMRKKMPIARKSLSYVN